MTGLAERKAQWQSRVHVKSAARAGDQDPAGTGEAVEYLRRPHADIVRRPGAPPLTPR
jgi:hypothetical protein